MNCSLPGLQECKSLTYAAIEPLQFHFHGEPGGNNNWKVTTTINITALTVRSALSRGLTGGGLPGVPPPVHARHPPAAHCSRSVLPAPSCRAGTSEHLLSGRSTQLELHIVTKVVARKGFSLPKECRNGETCLAVFGVLYE